jgi:hypothetical protein
MSMNNIGVILQWSKNHRFNMHKLLLCCSAIIYAIPVPTYIMEWGRDVYQGKIYWRSVYLPPSATVKLLCLKHPRHNDTVQFWRGSGLDISSRLLGISIESSTTLYHGWATKVASKWPMRYVSKMVKLYNCCFTNETLYKACTHQLPMA